MDIENVDAVQRKLHFALPTDKLRKDMDKRLAELRKSMRVPGFRPNRVPISLVRARYGRQVELEIILDAAADAMEEAVERHNLKIVSEYEFESDPTDLRISEEGEVRFIIAVEVRPPLHIPPYNSFSVDKSPVNVTPKEVEEELEALRAGRSHYSPIDEKRPAQMGDSVQLIMDNLEKDLTPEPIEVWTDLREDGNEKLAQAVVGMEIGDNQLVVLTGMDGEDARHYVELTQIAVKEEAVLDDAFAQQLGVETMDKLRGEVWNRMIERREREQKEAQTDDIFDQLLERIQCSVPDLLIDQTLQNMRSKDIPVSMDDESRRQVERMIRRDWILEEIAEREGIEVSEEEAEASVRAEARRLQDDPDQSVKKLRESEDWDGYVHAVQVKRIIDLLIERASQKGIITP